MNFKTAICAMAFALAIVTTLAGCAGLPTAPPMSREEVISLSQQGTSPETMRMAAATNGLAFPLSAENMLWLRERGIDDDHLQALLSAAGERQVATAKRPGRDAVTIGYDLARWLGPSALSGSLTMPPRSIVNDAVQIGTKR